MPETYTLDDILQELNAGIFVQQCTEALKQVALGVINNNKDGSVTIKLSLSRIGEGDSVKVKHSLQYNQPTMRGKKSKTARCLRRCTSIETEPYPSARYRKPMYLHRSIAPTLPNLKDQNNGPFSN